MTGIGMDSRIGSKFLNPGVGWGGTRYCESVEELAADADALVLVTEWREFRDLDMVKLARMMATPVLVDGRNLFRVEVAAGFDYVGIGRVVRPRGAGAQAPSDVRGD
jgi:UDP-glucose 6-dehydrogenase